MVNFPLGTEMRLTVLKIAARHNSVSGSLWQASKGCSGPALGLHHQTPAETWQVTHTDMRLYSGWQRGNERALSLTPQLCHLGPGLMCLVQWLTVTNSTLSNETARIQWIGLTVSPNCTCTVLELSNGVCSWQCSRSRSQRAFTCWVIHFLLSAVSLVTNGKTTWDCICPEEERGTSGCKKRTLNRWQEAGEGT